MSVKKEKYSGTERLKHQARDYSIQEGIFFRGTCSFGLDYLSPFAIAINASNSIVAALSSVSGLITPLSQLLGSKLLEKHSRKEIAYKAVFFQALIWPLMILLAYLYSQNIITTTLPFLFLFFFAIYELGGIATPAWFSWLGDIVDKKKRGRWFAKRNTLFNITSLALTLLAALFLDFFKSQNKTMWGFMILFALAGLARYKSSKAMKIMYEPKIRVNKKDNFSFLEFIKKASQNNFGKFSIFRAMLSFATSISGPLIAVYLLRNLEFSYTLYMMILLAPAVYRILVVKLWGKFADKYGNYRVFVLTTILIPTIPILWILNPSPIYLLLIPPIIRGISWAGFDLAANDFIYDNVSKEKRGTAISHYNILQGIGIFFGAGLGAILIKFLDTNIMEPIILIFILGSIARMIVVFWWIPRLKEVRKTKRPKDMKQLEREIIKEIKPTLKEEWHEIRSIKDYII